MIWAALLGWSETKSVMLSWVLITDRVCLFTIPCITLFYIKVVDDSFWAGIISSPALLITQLDEYWIENKRRTHIVIFYLVPETTLHRRIKCFTGDDFMGSLFNHVNWHTLHKNIIYLLIYGGTSSMPLGRNPEMTVNQTTP